MKITSNWLKDHLDTKLTENQIIDKLTDIGLEVESVDSQSSDLESFVVAKILKSEKKVALVTLIFRSFIKYRIIATMQRH